MLFLKKKGRCGRNAGPACWVDAVESATMMVNAYPKNSGEGTLAERFKRLMEQEFAKQVYVASYTHSRHAEITDQELVILLALPLEIHSVGNL